MIDLKHEPSKKIPWKCFARESYIDGWVNNNNLLKGPWFADRLIPQLKKLEALFLFPNLTYPGIIIIDTIENMEMLLKKFKQEEVQ